MNKNNLTKFFLISGYSDRMFFILFIFIFSLLIIDLGLSKFTDVIPEEITSSPVVTLFILITTICAFGQYYFYVKLRRVQSQSKFKSLYPKELDEIVGIVNYTIIATSMIIILQLITYHSYNIILILLNATLSYGMGASLTAILSRRFIGWFVTKRDLVLLLYGLATAAISINLIITLIAFDTVLLNKVSSFGGNMVTKIGASVGPNTTLDIRDNYTSHDVSGTAGEILVDAETHSVDAYYILTWIATALLLHYNVKRIGKIKYWSLFVLALVYFFSYYISPVDLFQPTSSNEDNSVIIFYLLFATYSITIGGVLFGIGFWFISRKIKIENRIRDFMNIVAIGIILFFTAGEATTSQTSFPPFGLANVSFVGLSCYLLLAGLTFSALSVLQDVELRKYIKNYANEEAKLFRNMGMAERENKLKNRVISFAKLRDKISNEETKIQASLSEDEIKKYVDEVIEEISRKKQGENQ